MLSRRLLLTTALVAASATLPGAALAHDPIKVVATFSILGDMVARVGGDEIELTTLVGPNGDAHVYQPTPQAAKAVAEADVLILNGLEFEGWLERLTEAASFDGALVVATTGVDALDFDGHDEGHDEEGHDDHAGHDDHGDEHGDDHAEHSHDDHSHDEASHSHDDHDHDHDHGEEHAEHKHDDAKHDNHGDDHAGHDDHASHDGHDDHDDHAGHNHGAFDPHAWQSPTLAVTYVDNITAALAQASPEHAADFYANRAAYVAELEALHEDITAMVATIPAERRTIVTSHDAFQYFGRDYGLTFKAPQGLSTDSEASAKDVAAMIEQMREDGTSAVFIENIADSRLLEQIAKETGASIGGRLYPGALSGPDGPAATYIDMMRHNATTISQALGS